MPTFFRNNSNQSGFQSSSVLVEDELMPENSEELVEVEEGHDSDPDTFLNDYEEGVFDLKRQEEGQNQKYYRKKGFSWGKAFSLLLLFGTVFALISGAWFGYKILAANNPEMETASGISLEPNNNINTLGLLPDVGRFLAGGKTTLKGENDGRTNILLIGVDTEAGLTDTLMIASYFHTEKKVTTVNIPRDFYVRLPADLTDNGYGYEKINGVYSLAQDKYPQNPGYPPQLLSNFLSSEFDLPIHYWASVDFSGLEQVIDVLGGVEVEVENYFEDCQFPDQNYGYLPCQTFQAGKQNMDGETALIYARSRKSLDNGEGSDFARSRRQSILIQSILAKVKSLGVIGNLTKINSYLSIVNQNMKTNLQNEEIITWLNDLKNFDSKRDFARVVWDTGPQNEILCDSQNSLGAYIIVYCGGQIPGEVEIPGEAKRLARQTLANIFTFAQLDALYQTPMLIVGNNSNQALEAYNVFSQIGFKKLELNNTYMKINGQSSIEKTSIYVTNSETLQLFSALNPKPNLDYVLYDGLPSRLNLPSSDLSPQIVVWVE